MRFSKALAAAFSAALLCSCSSRSGETLRGEVDVSDPQAAHGRTVFMSKCSKCHPGGEAGLGPALNNTMLPEFLVMYQARHGVGSMPAFDAEEIPDGDLQDITVYLKALRRNIAGKAPIPAKDAAASN